MQEVLQQMQKKFADYFRCRSYRGYTILAVMVTLIGSEIGNRIYKLRDLRGWSQKELAFLAKVPQPWLSTVESGEIREPSAVRTLRVADALGVSVRYLVSGVTDNEAIEAVPDGLWFGQLASTARSQLRKIHEALADLLVDQQPNDRRDSSGEEDEG